MRKINIITSIVILLGSGGLYYYVSTFPVRPGRLAALNTGFYPKILVAIMALLGLILLVSSLVQKNQGTRKLLVGMTRKNLNQLLITVGMLVSFPFILDWFGFPVATFVFIGTMTYLLSDKSKYKVSTLFLVTLTSTIVMYLVFRKFLTIPFPRGIFFS